MESICIQYLPEKIEIDNCNLELKTDRNEKPRIFWGRNNLSKIRWYVYEITNASELKMLYNQIVLSPCRIVQGKELDNAKKNILTKEISRCEDSNIDAITGNIHILNEMKDGYSEIKQLVLCNNDGPQIQGYSEDDENIYYNYVHKACYYPLIKDNDKKNDKLTSNWRYKLLSNLWEKLSETKGEEKVL